MQNQTVDGATYTVEFDHDGDNANWVEFQARAGNGDGLVGGAARVEGSSTWHYMEFAANTYERTQQGWKKFQPDVGFNVPTGKRVQFKVGMTDGATGQSAEVLSCFFTHPAGVEQCGSSTTTTTTSSSFDASFAGFRGNEWWVQAKVGTNGPDIAKVDVRVNNGAWMPLSKQNWGTAPPSWAGSYHFPQGSILQMRATAVDGRTDLSDCRKWIPASGQDAPVVLCPGTSTTTTTASPTTHTFTNVAGNRYWQEVVVKPNTDLYGVYFTVNCGDIAHEMQYRSDWGKWISSEVIPDGSKLVFKAWVPAPGGPAHAITSESDTKGYIWPQATPTSAC